MNTATASGTTVPTRLDRWSGACWMGAGVLLLLGTLHPDIFATTLAEVSRRAVWVPVHVAALVAVVLTLIGLVGLYGTRAERLGRLGAAGMVCAVVGLVMTACVSYAEAFLLPVIARDHPEVFDWDGPVTTAWAVRTTTAMALLWLVGLVLLGVALCRSGVVPARAGLTVAVAAVAFSVFGGLLIPVLSPLSVLALAVGYAWVGLALWTGATGASGAPPSQGRRVLAADRHD
jgi:hypothetical protein